MNWYKVHLHCTEAHQCDASGAVIQTAEICVFTPWNVNPPARGDAAVWYHGWNRVEEGRTGTFPRITKGLFEKCQALLWGEYLLSLRYNPWLSECDRRFSCLSTPSCVYSARHTQVDKYTRCYHTALTAIWMSFNLPRHRRSFSSAQALHSCLSMYSQKLPPLIWTLKAPRVRSRHPAVPADAVWDMGCKDTEPASTPLCGHIWRDSICLWSSFRTSNRDRRGTADSPIFETRLLIMQLSLRPYSIKLPNWIARAVRSHFLFFSMNVMLIAYIERERPYHVKNAGFTCKRSLAHFKCGPRAVLRPAQSTLLLLIGNLVGGD